MDKEMNCVNGVVIGRFQTAALTVEHVNLLTRAFRKSNRLLVLIGNSPLQSSTRNPLDFFSVQHMIKECVPHATILPLQDCPTNQLWSDQIDTLLHNLGFNVGETKLFGGRDCFIPSYGGSFSTFHVESIECGSISASEQREETGKKILDTYEKRFGAIWATQHQWHERNAKMTVDMIIWRDESRTEFLVGTKPKDPRWRLPGGFVDNGETLEEAALREIHEETYIDFASLSSLSYKSSYRIHDWRYEPLGMAITTAFFSCVAPIGYRPRPGDDLNTLKWQSLQEFKVMVNSGQIDESKWVISHTKMIKDFL